MDRSLLLNLWDESWSEGIWIAPWVKAVQDLTPEQAAWNPAANRHNIWQIVNHVCVWREYTLALLAGGARPTRPDSINDNFAMPDSPNLAAWKQTLGRLQATHDEFARAIPNPATSLERVPYHLGHDCYHLGQIMYLRALQGLAPIE
jgi:hypothetical protein